MKKRVLIIALISIAIVVGLSFVYFLFYKSKPQFTGITEITISDATSSVTLRPKNLSEQIEKYPSMFVALCPPPEEGYIVCHIRENKVVEWKGEALNCGEPVFFQVRLKYDPSKYYACRTGDTLLGVSRGGFKNFFFCETDPAKGEISTTAIGKIPLKSGKFILMEIYLVPREFPLEEVQPNLNRFEKILELHVDVKC
jgi:hypothetical protein